MTSFRLLAFPVLFLSTLTRSIGQGYTLSMPTIEVSEDRILHIPGQARHLPDSLDRLFLTAGHLSDQLRLYPGNHLRSMAPADWLPSAAGVADQAANRDPERPEPDQSLWGIIDYSQVPLFFFPPPSSGRRSDQSRRYSQRCRGDLTANRTGRPGRIGCRGTVRNRKLRGLSGRIGWPHLHCPPHQGVGPPPSRSSRERLPHTTLLGDSRRLPHADYRQRGALLDLLTQPAPARSSALWPGGRAVVDRFLPPRAGPVGSRTGGPGHPAILALSGPW